MENFFIFFIRCFENIKSNVVSKLLRHILKLEGYFNFCNCIMENFKIYKNVNFYIPYNESGKTFYICMHLSILCLFEMMQGKGAQLRGLGHL